MATERTVISALAPEQYGASAFVPAAKGIARFKMLDGKEFAECYFVGTFASSALAILVSSAIREVLVWSQRVLAAKAASRQPDSWSDVDEVERRETLYCEMRRRGSSWRHLERSPCPDEERRTSVL
ncbi:MULTISPECIES: hypothetical protein [Gordonibacter]|uniref:hypothetical protein n=1 Tax=Gordonibacter TaxID=644652 RepID=UPI001E1AC084|nr:MULTISPECIES: hypothetical protein [Gordonibacter]MDN4510610.1 hypothetical protein [Gordonibacter sp. RACS_AR49]HJF62177.1 hypothetical protein [Gordonibacter urolithinfaciens]